MPSWFLIFLAPVLSGLALDYFEAHYLLRNIAVSLAGACVYMNQSLAFILYAPLIRTLPIPPKQRVLGALVNGWVSALVPMASYLLVLAVVPTEKWLVFELLTILAIALRNWALVSLTEIKRRPLLLIVTLLAATMVATFLFKNLLTSQGLIVAAFWMLSKDGLALGAWALQGRK